MNNLAMAYADAGRLRDAEALYEETLNRKRVKLGADHPDTLATMNNLAMAHRDAGRLGDALPLLEETLKLKRIKLGADHPDTLLSMNGLAMAYRDVGRLGDALPRLEETLKLRKIKLGPDHPATLFEYEQSCHDLPGRRSPGQCRAAFRGNAQTKESQARSGQREFTYQYEQSRRGLSHWTAGGSRPSRCSANA